MQVASRTVPESFQDGAEDMNRRTIGICKSCFHNVYGDEEHRLCTRCGGLLHLECAEKRRGRCYFCDSTESLLFALRSGAGFLKGKSGETVSI